MVRFFVIQEFLNQIETLVEKPKYQYYSVKKDISQEIKRCNTIEQFCQMLERLYVDDKICLIKQEIKNSVAGLGKPDGFRLLYVVNKIDKHICFLFTFPKRGHHRRDNLTDDEYANLMTSYQKQKEGYKLIEVLPFDDFKIKEKKEKEDGLNEAS